MRSRSSKTLDEECDAIEHEADVAQSRQMDRTLYTLTIVSSVFLPAQFLTGVWGMNFEHMRELDEPWGYKMFWGLTTFLIISLLIFFNFGQSGQNTKNNNNQRRKKK